ncbi:MAG: fructose-bisphosphatase class II [bacterium]
MSSNLRFDIIDHPLSYQGVDRSADFSPDHILEFNHRHHAVLPRYELTLASGRILSLDDHLNGRSNLGAFRNRQLRESAVLAAALPAIAVGLHGRGALARLPKEQQTPSRAEQLKRANDRTAAQIMSEVLQNTTDNLPQGEEVIIESTITEGVRMKPGKEAGGNPTIAVGALFGKDIHRSQYGMPMSPNVTMLSMGSDVIDGTTKSVTGLHSSLTALFLTESNVKRHLPDVYVQGWAASAGFEDFNPRETNLTQAAEIIAGAYGLSGIDQLSAFFLDRPRHYPAMDALNSAGVATPFDKDGDLFPCLILGENDVRFPNGRCLNAMIGEIGGSAEWAVGVLPLVWRGGHALGMLTSQSALTRTNVSPEEKWQGRFHFTEEEFMLIQDARFERKPYFSIRDILEEPFAGGVSAFGAITDNAYLPFMKGASADKENRTVSVWTLVINSMGLMEAWQLTFVTQNSLDESAALLASPKDGLLGLHGSDLERAIGQMLQQKFTRERYRIFFNNEYYPALIPVSRQMVVLHQALEGLIRRGALIDHDREIVEITERLAPDWFGPHAY